MTEMTYNNNNTADCVVSRTVCQFFTRGLMTGVNVDIALTLSLIHTLTHTPVLT